MKKRFLAVPVVLGVAGASWAGGTLYGGSMARQAYDQLLSNAGDASAFTFAPVSYQAGFLHSEAVTQLRTGSGDDAPTLIRLHHLIEHSPLGGTGLRAARILTTADTSELDPQLALLIESLFKGKMPLTVESVIGLDGDAQHAIKVAAWEHEDDTMTVVSEPMEWTVTATDDKVISGTGFWPGLTLASDGNVDVHMTLGASHDRFDYRHVDGGLYVGEYVAELGELSASSTSTGMDGTLSGMRVLSATDIAEDVYRGESVLEIASMRVPVELDSLRLRVGFDGLPVTGMSDIDAASHTLDAATLADDDAATRAALESYLAAIGTVLQPGLSMDYALELANDGGKAVLDYTMDWDGPGGADPLAEMQTLGDLLRAIRATLALDVDADALAMTPVAMFVDPDALQPWIVGDADGYRSDITIKDLVLNINGQPMPLQAMVGDVLQEPLRGLLDRRD